MSLFNVDNLCFGYDDKVLLKNITFQLFKGEHAGLVGNNGTGKTTLFNILCGELAADSGDISRPSTIKVGYLDQHSELKEGFTIRESLEAAFEELYELEKKLLKVGESLGTTEGIEAARLLKVYGKLQDSLYASEFYNISSLIDNVAAGLGLFALGMNTEIEKLSGGQKTKVRLAKLLLGRPDILLLDEPTNYLDKEHVDWLTDYLVNYPNSFIVVSHDTEFLNRITNVIFHLEFTRLKRYPGNYNTFLRLKDEESKRYIEQYNRQQQEIARMEDFINKNIVRATTTKRAQSRRKQLEKIERLEKPKLSPKPRFTFLPARESTRIVFNSNKLNIGYSYPIINNLNLQLIKGEKIAITGCNGIGKSTLLKTIMGVIPPLGGEVKMGDFLYPVYFEQETKVADNTALEEVWSCFPDKTQKEIREALSKCGLRQELVFQKMSSLSGGEQSKVRLCKLMLTPGNWLLLDEPTNHLDLDAKYALKEALRKFNGTVLLVCHEEEFYEDIVSGVWDMERYAGTAYKGALN